MVALTSLWLPVVVAAVLVFVASSIIHMALGYHNTDYGKLPREDDVIAALRPMNIPPGDYFLPWAGGAAGMKDPVFQEKWQKGPVATMTVLPPGANVMGAQLAQWFVYTAVVAFFAGYVASRTIPAGGDYLTVFRVVGTTAFMGYALGLWQMTIWYKRSVTTTLKSTFDALVYACLTAGAFGWLWPAA
ncbi:MAG: hypothetical protein AB7U83_05360 [Vicinamibacterales bacterium]